MDKAVYACDLHCHTTCSDGADTPQELILHAAKRGIKVLAITDHDVIPPSDILPRENGARVDICEYAASKGIRLLRGIEISCETEVEDVHIVCFGCDWGAPFFEKLRAETVQSKINGYKLLIERLREDGMLVTWEEVLQNGGNQVKEENVQKKMIFELLARKGYAKDWSEAKLLIKSTEKYQIKRKKPDPTEVIREIHCCGGYTIMAHPFLIDEPIVIDQQKLSRADYFERLIEAGLDGIEACYTYGKTSYSGELDSREIENYIREKYEGRLLIISGGSDYHADQKKGVKNPRQLGEAGVTEEYFMSNPVLHILDYSCGQ